MTEVVEHTEENKGRLKFKFIYNERPCLLPQGYRLATLEEFRNNRHILRKWGLPIKGTERSSREGSLDLCLLDGFIQGYNNNFDEPREHDDWYIGCEWIVAVKKKEWDNTENKWWNSSAFYSSNGGLLRKQLYDGIKLDKVRGGNIAWCNAFYHEDMELLYWLWKNHKLPSDSVFNTVASRVDFPLKKMVERLRSCQTGTQLQMENAREEVQIVLDYAKGKGTCNWRVGMLELFIEVYGNAFAKAAVEIETTNAESIPIFTKLLSLPQLEIQIPINKYAEVLIEAVERRYSDLVKKMSQLRDDIDHINTDDCVRALRGAVRGGFIELVGSLVDLLKSRDGVELPIEVDERRKTLFHYALFHENVFRRLQKIYADSGSDHNIITRQDINGRNFLHWAAKGACDLGELYNILDHERLRLICRQRDNRGRTPLHIAASKGNSGMIKKLLHYIPDGDKSKYIQETDSSGQTALQMAASEGYVYSVKTLLEEGSQPLNERDNKKRTALHCAALVKDPKLALATCKTIVDKTDISVRELLLWASATGIGTADEMEGVDSDVEKYLRETKIKDCGKDLLRKAAVTENADMAWELLNRGADMAEICNPEWTDGLSTSQQNAVRNVIRHMDRMKEQGRDQPTMEDNLGRTVFAEGVAALLFNRFVESPITVGISGDWGMGKSSLMIQIEKILLITAAQLAFPNLLPTEKFDGAKKISLSTRGRKIYQQIKRGLNILPSLSKDKSKNPISTVLTEYQSQYRAIYKSLACMDNNQMLESNSVSQGQEHALGGVPRILTIQYNAWHYRGRLEAWAGLAVTITKEIEKAMTRAQWMSTCWRYTWAKQKTNIWIYIFLPCLISITLAGWVAWIVWILLKEARFEGLKYGSIPITVIAIAWVVLKSIISVVKPVSTQMLGYITSPDHTSHLGYQDGVINDINFLKEELGNRPHWFFSFILGVWCWNWFGLYADVIVNTRIPKFFPASGDRIRIVTFVDDLDRCEEEVILQVLSAVNLILAECKINAILGIDKKMVARAIRRKFKDVDGEDIAEKFISKVIQIPLSLPDPTEKETVRFLEYHLGHKITGIEAENVFGRPRGIAVTLEPSTGKNASQHSSVYIEDEHASQRNKRAIIINPVKWLSCLLGSVCTIRCKISNMLKHPYEEESYMFLRSTEGVRLIAEILLPNYTEEEAVIFYKLSKLATGNQKLPREWKRLLSYHKFAWYVLLRIGNIYNLPTWKVELIGWIFVCWQWKQEMNFLIKNWHKYTGDQNKDGRKRYCRCPPLSEIVAEIANADPMDQSKLSHKGEIVAEPMDKFDVSQILVPEGNYTTQRYESLTMKLGSTSRQDPSILCFYRDDEIIGEGTLKNNWSKLQEALKIRDVSMEAIQLFQQFRLHCETDYLSWDVSGVEMSHS